MIYESHVDAISNHKMWNWDPWKKHMILSFKYCPSVCTWLQVLEGMYYHQQPRFIWLSSHNVRTRKGMIKVLPELTQVRPDPESVAILVAGHRQCHSSPPCEWGAWTQSCPGCLPACCLHTCISIIPVRRLVMFGLRFTLARPLQDAPCSISRKSTSLTKEEDAGSRTLDHTDRRRQQGRTWGSPRGRESQGRATRRFWKPERVPRPCPPGEGWKQAREAAAAGCPLWPGKVAPPVVFSLATGLWSDVPSASPLPWLWPAGRYLTHGSFIHALIFVPVALVCGKPAGWGTSVSGGSADPRQGTRQVRGARPSALAGGRPPQAAATCRLHPGSAGSVALSEWPPAGRGWALRAELVFVFKGDEDVRWPHSKPVRRGSRRCPLRSSVLRTNSSAAHHDVVGGRCDDPVGAEGPSNLPRPDSPRVAEPGAERGRLAPRAPPCPPAPLPAEPPRNPGLLGGAPTPVPACARRAGPCSRCRFAFWKVTMS